MIVLSASMTLHPVRTNGMVLSVQQIMVYLSKIQNRVNDFILHNSRISEKQLDQMMRNTQEMTTDMGTVLSRKEAVFCGLIDRLGNIHDAVEEL